jgi:hypothetical protein
MSFSGSPWSQFVAFIQFLHELHRLHRSLIGSALQTVISGLTDLPLLQAAKLLAHPHGGVLLSSFQTGRSPFLLSSITTGPTGQFTPGRDRGTARNLRRRLGCSGVSALRARLAFSIVHVSVRPPCHPGRSHLASPVGDHDCPCAIFPDSPWLKRSLAYTPGAKGLPRSSIVVCHLNYAGTESGMSDTSATRHDREPLRTLEVLPLG